MQYIRRCKLVGDPSHVHSGSGLITRGQLVVPVQISGRTGPRAWPEGRPCVVAELEMPLPTGCPSWPAVRGGQQEAISAAPLARSAHSIQTPTHKDSQVLLVGLVTVHFFVLLGVLPVRLGLRVFPRRDHADRRCPFFRNFLTQDDGPDCFFVRRLVVAYPLDTAAGSERVGVRVGPVF